MFKEDKHTFICVLQVTTSQSRDEGWMHNSNKWVIHVEKESHLHFMKHV